MPSVIREEDQATEALQASTRGECPFARDVILLILELSTDEDFCRFCLSCKQVWSAACNSDWLWKSRFSQRFLSIHNYAPLTKMQPSTSPFSATSVYRRAYTRACREELLLLRSRCPLNAPAATSSRTSVPLRLKSQVCASTEYCNKNGYLLGRLIRGEVARNDIIARDNLVLFMSYPLGVVTNASVCSLRLWDTRTGALITLSTFGTMVSLLSWEGTEVIISTNQHTVSRFELQTEPNTRLLLKNDFVLSSDPKCSVVQASGNIVITATEGGGVCVWNLDQTDPTSHDPAPLFQLEEDAGADTSYRPDGRFFIGRHRNLVVGSDARGCIRTWDLSTGKLLSSIRISGREDEFEGASFWCEWREPYLFIGIALRNDAALPCDFSMRIVCVDVTTMRTTNCGTISNDLLLSRFGQTDQLFPKLLARTCIYGSLLLIVFSDLRPKRSCNTADVGGMNADASFLVVYDMRQQRLRHLTDISMFSNGIPNFVYCWRPNSNNNSSSSSSNSSDHVDLNALISRKPLGRGSSCLQLFELSESSSADHHHNNNNMDMVVTTQLGFDHFKGRETMSVSHCTVLEAITRSKTKTMRTTAPTTTAAATPSRPPMLRKAVSDSRLLASCSSGAANIGVLPQRYYPFEQ